MLGTYIESDYHDKKHPAVIKAVTYIQDICRNNRIPFSLAGYLRKDEISFYKKMGVDRITVNYVNLPQLNKRFEKLPELDLLLKIKENTKRRREILANKEGAK